MHISYIKRDDLKIIYSSLFYHDNYVKIKNCYRFVISLHRTSLPMKLQQTNTRYGCVSNMKEISTNSLVPIESRNLYDVRERQNLSRA